MTISTAESRVREVWRDDRSDGIPVCPALSGSSLEVSWTEPTGLEAKSVVDVPSTIS